MISSDRHQRAQSGRQATSRRRKAGTSILLLLGLLVGFVGIAPSASAHHAYLQGNVSSVCDPTTGQIRVSFSVASWGRVDSGQRVLNSSIGIQYRLGDSATFADVTVPISGFSADATTGAFIDNNAGATPTFSGTFLLPAADAGKYLQLRAYPKAAWRDVPGTTRAANPEGDDSFVIAPDPLKAGCTPPATPSATAAVACQSDAIVISFTGTGSATTVDVRKNGSLVGNHPVPVGPSTFNVPLTAADENTTVTVGLDYAAASATDQSLQVPVNCLTPPVPTADVQWTCGADATVVLGNTGQETILATITKNGTPVHTDVPVPPGGTSRTVAITGDDEGTDVTISITFSDAGTGTDVTEVLPVDCDQPAPTIGTPECAEDGLRIALGNEGDDDAKFTIVIDGNETTQVVGAGQTATLTIPVAEGDTVAVTITSGDVSYSNPALERDCEKPAATVVFDCAEGGVVVTVTNSGELPTTVLVDGQQVVVDPGQPYTVTIPVAEGEQYSVTVTGDDGLDESASGTRNCEKPAATVVFDCAEGGVVVTVTNSGELPTTVLVDGQQVVVDPGQPYTVTIPVAEGEQYSVTVTGDDGLDESASGTRNCEEPAATVVFDCAEGGVVVTVTNSGELPTTVLVDGQQVVVDPGVPYTVTIPVAEGEQYSVTVTGDGIDQSVSGTRNCEEPAATVVFDCAEGGVVVTVTNSGELPTTVLVDGQQVVVDPGQPYTVTIPVAEGEQYSVTVTGDDGLDESASGTRNCEEPEIEAISLECAEGGVVVVLTNTGELPATVTVDGEPVVIPAGGSTSVTVPVAENDSYDFDVVIDGETTNVTGVRDCEQPGIASALLECAAGGLVVVLTNSGDADTVVTVAGNPINVPAGTTAESPVSVTVPVAENDAYDITVTGDELEETYTGVRQCEQPQTSSVQLECAEGGVVVLLTNDGASDTLVTVAGNEVAVPAGTTAEAPLEVLVPVAENAAYDFAVVGDGLDQVFSGTANCLEPEPSVDQSVVCARGGVGVVLRNTGEDTATFVVASPALPDGDVTTTVEAGATETVVVPLAEDTSTTLTVTSGDEVLFDGPVTRSCETVEGEVVTPTPLPRTGSETRSLLALAGGLLLAGSVLVNGGRRRLVAVR